MNIPDCVGRSFLLLEEELKEQGIDYFVQRTYGRNKRFVTDDTCLYVIRQQMRDNVLVLTLAAKMGKEVS